MSFFLFVSSLLIRFSLPFSDLALTADNLMFFTISSFSSVVTIYLRFHMSIQHVVFLLFLFLIFLVLLFNLSSQIVLIVPKGRLVILVGVVCLWISLSCSLVYEYVAPGLVLLALVGLLFMVSDLGVVEEISVHVISIQI